MSEVINEDDVAITDLQREMLSILHSHKEGLLSSQMFKISTYAVKVNQVSHACFHLHKMGLLSREIKDDSSTVYCLTARGRKVVADTACSVDAGEWGGLLSGNLSLRNGATGKLPDSSPFHVAGKKRAGRKSVTDDAAFYVVDISIFRKLAKNAMAAATLDEAIDSVADMAGRTDQKFMVLRAEPVAEHLREACAC